MADTRPPARPATASPLPSPGAMSSNSGSLTLQIVRVRAGGAQPMFLRRTLPRPQEHAAGTVVPRLPCARHAQHRRTTPQSPSARTCQTYTYVAMWIATSAGVILWNKYILAYSGFPYPVTLTLWWV